MEDESEVNKVERLEMLGEMDLSPLPVLDEKREATTVEEVMVRQATERRGRNDLEVLPVIIGNNYQKAKEHCFYNPEVFKRKEDLNYQIGIVERRPEVELSLHTPFLAPRKNYPEKEQRPIQLRRMGSLEMISKLRR